MRRSLNRCLQTGVVSLLVIAGGCAWRVAHPVNQIKADAGGNFTPVGHPDIAIYVGEEGLPLTLDASASTSTDSLVSYEWDYESDGIYDTTSHTSQVKISYPNNFDGKVRVRITDAGGRTAVATTKLSIADVAPGIEFTPPNDVLLGERFEHTIHIFEPGNDSVSIHVDFGDGTTIDRRLPATPKQHRLELRHAYQAAGTYDVSVTAVDDSSRGMTRTRTVRVKEAQAGGILGADFDSPFALGEPGQRIRLELNIPHSVDRISLHVALVEGNIIPMGDFKTNDDDRLWSVQTKAQTDSTREIFLSRSGAAIDSTKLSLYGEIEHSVKTPTVTAWNIQALLQDKVVASGETFHLAYQLGFVEEEPIYEIPEEPIYEILEGPCFLYLTATPYPWIPENSNTVKHIAFIIARRPKHVRFDLSGVSTEPGDALNHPLMATVPTPDLQFVQGHQIDPNIRVIDKDEAATILPTYRATIVTTSYDFGSYGVLAATACGQRLSRKIPLDDVPVGGNHIADVWDARYPGNLAAEADDDDWPKGLNRDGDGFSRYEEYRGFFENGQHKRTTPNDKDVFILDVNQIGLGTFPRLRYVNHGSITSTEVKPVTRQVDFNQETAKTTNHGTTDQYAIQLSNWNVVFLTSAPGVPGVPGAPGATSPLGPVTNAPQCMVDYRFITTPSHTMITPRHRGMLGPGVNPQQALDWVIGHELGHAVALAPPPFVHSHLYGRLTSPRPWYRRLLSAIGLSSKPKIWRFRWKSCSMNAMIPIKGPSGSGVPSNFCRTPVDDGYPCQWRHTLR